MSGLRFGFVTVALTMAAFFMMGCAGVNIALALPETLLVGKDIAMGDVMEFYYTYATSSYPPDYQRYHFYVKDGTPFFYHEKREGRHWPLRETDITISGTKELSQEEWKEFFSCVEGGTVVKRKENLESGNSGPWLFLYWKGDRSKYQEFSFVSGKARKSFENLCVRLKQK